jgi:hypothetical protein
MPAQVIRAHAVMQHGGSDAALHFVEAVFEADDQDAAPDVYMLSGDLPAGSCREVLGVPDGGFPGAAFSDQSRNEFSAEGDAQQPTAGRDLRWVDIAGIVDFEARSGPIAILGGTPRGKPASISPSSTGICPHAAPRSIEFSARRTVTGGPGWAWRLLLI